MDYRFTSFLKARLVCSRTSAASPVPYVFNEVCELSTIADCFSLLLLLLLLCGRLRVCDEVVNAADVSIN